LDLQSIARLPLLRDYDQDSWSQFDRAAEICREAFRERGYTTIDTPIIERTELFLRKSGGEIAAQLYSFTDPGGHAVSLRPEFTAPVIRYVIENGLLGDGALRFEYSGPVFRYPSHEEFDNGMTGSFTQTGTELIGPGGPQADAEVISMALDGLSRLGVRDARATVGHVGIIWKLMGQMALSERAQLFLINSVRALGDGRRDEVIERAERIGLIGRDSNAGPGEAGNATSAAQIESVLIQSIGSSFRGTLGQRSKEDVLQRLAEKTSSKDSADSVELAIDVLERLARVVGAPVDAIERGGQVVKDAGLDSGITTVLSEIVDAVETAGVPAAQIEVDLGLAREISYYTGVVFDLRTPDGQVLGGGGRYDGLVMALGGSMGVPSAGFAYNTDRVIERSEIIQGG
jgi:histidyl-tRNA synthetase